MKELFKIKFEITLEASEKIEELVDVAIDFGKELLKMELEGEKEE